MEWIGTEKTGHFLKVLDIVSLESHQKSTANSSLCHKSFQILSVGCQERCMCELTY